MLWINKNRNFVRVVVLAMFLLAILGPWTYDRIHVPQDYECAAPYIRLDGNFCGVPMSGSRLLTLFIGGFLYSIVLLVSGTFNGRAREFLMVLSFLPLLPFFSTVVLIWKRELLRLQAINLILWVLASIPILLILILQLHDQVIRLWGLWFYMILAITSIIIDIPVLTEKSTPRSQTL